MLLLLLLFKYIFYIFHRYCVLIHSMYISFLLELWYTSNVNITFWVFSFDMHLKLYSSPSVYLFQKSTKHLNNIVTFKYLNQFTIALLQWASKFFINWDQIWFEMLSLSIRSSAERKKKKKNSGLPNNISMCCEVLTEWHPL